MPLTPEHRNFPLWSIGNPAANDGEVPRRSGFALVIALSLMAFVLLLVTSLVSLVRVETRAAAGQKTILEARQNALLGLRVAIGELQRAAGPDRRATATADLTEDLTGDTRPNRNWATVWANEGVLDSGVFDSRANTPRQIRNAAGQPLWLVSGDATPANFPALADFDGATRSDASDKVVLVGEGSAGSDPDNFVLAPKEDVAGGASTRASGRFAWWVGDESVKAKLGAIEPDARIEAAKSGEVFAEIARSSVAPRVGAEAVTGIVETFKERYFDGSAVGRDFRRLLRGATGFDALALADGAESIFDLPNLGERFHDLGFFALGVIADAQNGGLRGDLTAALGDRGFNENEEGDDLFVEAFTDGDANPFETWQDLGLPKRYLYDTLPGYTGPGGASADVDITATGESRPVVLGPSWDIVRDYYTQYEDTRGRRDVTLDLKPTANFAIFPNEWHKKRGLLRYKGLYAQSDPGDARFNFIPYRSFTSLQEGFSDRDPERNRRTHGLAPVITRWDMNYYLSAYSVGGGYALRLENQMFVTVANPYDVAIDLDSLDFTWNFGSAVEADATKLRGGFRFLFKLIDNQAPAGEPDPFVAWDLDDVDNIENLKTGTYPSSGSGVKHNSNLNDWLKEGHYKFDDRDLPTASLKVNGTLQPGEIKVFTLDSSGGNSLEWGRAGSKSDEDHFAEGEEATAGSFTGGRYYDIYFADTGNRFPVDASYQSASGSVPLLPYADDLNDEVEVGLGAFGRLNPFQMQVRFNGENLLAVNLTGFFPGPQGVETFGPGYRSDYREFFASGHFTSNPYNLTKWGSGGYEGLRFSYASLVNNRRPLFGFSVQMRTPEDQEVSFPPDGGSGSQEVGMVKPLASLNPRATTSSQQLSNHYPNESHMYRFVMLTDSEMGAGYPVIDGNGFWGESHTGAGSARVQLFHVPRQPLLSIGQLQHANLSVYGNAPAYMVGNSMPTHLVPDDTLFDHHKNIFQENDWVTNLSMKLRNQRSFEERVQKKFTYDMVWPLNEALWDEWFFSSVPVYDLVGRNGPDVFLPDPGGYGNFSNDGDLQQYLADRMPLPNPRMAYYGNPDPDALAEREGLRGVRTAAAGLLIDGAFNVNSTSVEAWKAVLAAANGIDVETLNAGAETDLDVPAMGTPTPLGGKGDEWSGFNTISASNLQALAERIVAEVKERGPFLSLADFVNRDYESADGDNRNAGVLQEALDAVVNFSKSVDLAAKNPLLGDLGVNEAFSGGVSDSYRPGWIKQGDLLTMLGPVLTNRADTFVVRAYGETANPSTGEPVASAWCEAIVQRVPDYVDPADAPETEPDSLSSETNTDFGRQFKIVAFRWLDEEDV